MIKETAIKGFTNEDFGTIRSVVIDDIPWFVGKDVATILGYTNPNEAMTDHVDEEDKLNSKTLLGFIIDIGQRGGWLINESGLYSLILSSKLPTAKKFKRWITSDVLPAIRQNGGYCMNGSSTSHHTNNLTYTEMQDWKYSIAYPIMNELCDALSKESREVLDSIYSKMERLGDGSFYNFVRKAHTFRCGMDST
jgi:prophage antirepressor-like protein